MTRPTPGRPRSFRLLCIEWDSITQALDSLGDDLPNTMLTTKPRKAQIQIISYRLSAGWSAEEAFGYLPPPKSAQKGYAHPIRCSAKVFPSKTALASNIGISNKLLGQRLNREKWPVEAAAGLTAPPDYLARLGATRGCIYMWNHKPSNKKYIGLTIDPERRNWQHAALSKSKNAAPGTLQHAMATHGRDQFEFLVLEENIPASDLPAREKYWIKAWGTLKPRGFNQNAGGVLGGVGSPVVIGGVTHSGFRAVAAHYQITTGMLARRIKRGWSLEEAVGLTGRKSKTRSPIELDICARPTRFTSTTAACRHWGVRHSDMRRSVKKGGKSWENAIVDALINKTHQAMEGAKLDSGVRGFAKRLPPSNAAPNHA